jgi:hypothetical protein
MYKKLMRVFVHVWFEQDAYIMKGAKISIIQVNEQSAMVQDHRVIRKMHFLLLVEP